jgi:hypothetical protein
MSFEGLKCLDLVLEERSLAFFESLLGNDIALFSGQYAFPYEVYPLPSGKLGLSRT